MTKIVTLAVFAGVLAYMGFQIAEALYHPLKTVAATLFETEDTFQASGYFVRDERLLEAQTGITQVLVSEGQRVGKLQTIAETYASDAALEAQKELSGLEERIALLETAASRGSDVLDAGKLDELVRSQIYSLEAAVDKRDFSELRAQSSELQSLVFRRQFAFSDPQQLTAIIAELKTRRDGIKASAAGVRAISSPESGVFSGVVDGYERALTPKVLEQLSVQTLDGFSKLQEPVAENQYLGKLVRGFDWYFAAAVDSAQAKQLKEGATARLRFSKSLSGALDAQVCSISPDEGGRTAVVFKSKDFLWKTLAVRRQTADIIYKQYQGVKLPREAIRISPEGVRGVYCLIGLQAKFKPVEIIYDSGTYCLSAYDASSESTLRPGDEIIVAARELFDGKIVK